VAYAATRVKVLVIGAGLSGLAAADRLLDHGAEVVIIDAFPRPGGRVANFDVATPVAGLIPGDVVEHGLHAWFQHYRALFELMGRAGIPKPPFAGDREPPPLTRPWKCWTARRRTGGGRLPTGPQGLSAESRTLSCSF